MSAPGVPRITGYEQGVWTVQPSLTDRLRRKFTGFRQANEYLGKEDMTMSEAADYIETLEARAGVSLASIAHPTDVETNREDINHLGIAPKPRNIVDELMDVIDLPAGTANSDINVVPVAVPVYVVQAAIAEIKRLQGQVDSLQDSQYWSCE